jgi:hypothetical protein
MSKPGGKGEKMINISRRFVLGGLIAAPAVVKYGNIMKVVDRGLWTSEGWYSLTDAGVLIPWKFDQAANVALIPDILGHPIYIRRDTYTKSIMGIRTTKLLESTEHWIATPCGARDYHILSHTPSTELRGTSCDGISTNQWEKMDS